MDMLIILWLLFSFLVLVFTLFLLLYSSSSWKGDMRSINAWWIRKHYCWISSELSAIIELGLQHPFVHFKRNTVKQTWKIFHLLTPYSLTPVQLLTIKSCRLIPLIKSLVMIKARQQQVQHVRTKRWMPRLKQAQNLIRSQVPRLEHRQLLT